MVKRSHGINVHNLIQQIENHPQRKALQSDLQQHRAFNPFSKESKDAIKAAGNTELCEIVDVEPKAQCRACLTYWDVGIVYCTCGHLLEDDTTENKKYISSVLDLFSIPNFYIRKGRPHGHRYGKKEGCREFHTAKQLQKRCRKKKYENIHDRFIRDTTFRKTMIQLGRSENVILEMDRFASEDHSHIATEEEIAVCRGKLVDPLKFGEFRHDADKASTWLQESIVDIVPPQESGWQETQLKLVAQCFLMVAMAHNLVTSLLWDFTTKIEWTLIERGNLCASVN